MKRISPLLLAALLAAPACSSSNTGGDDTMTGSGSGSATTGDQWDTMLGERVVDYNAALRIASLRLTGDLPTMDDINAVANAADDAAKKTAYEGLIDKYLASPQFAKQMFYFWRDTFKQGGDSTTFDPMLDTAPALAAELSVNDGAYTDLFTKATGNCPTFDMGTGTFTDADCGNGGAPAAQMTDYLPATETTAWRMGVPVADMTALGGAMAQDPDVAACGVARIWNWALGKTDIVDTLEEVPAETIQAQIDAFKGNGFKLKSLIKAVYTSDDFVKF